MYRPFRTAISSEWIDYNGHLNEGYFAVIFGLASDHVLLELGFDETYRSRERGTFYTVEAHIRFLNELKVGDPLRVDTRILGVDQRRVAVWHELYRDNDEILAGSQEAMFLHVDSDEVRVKNIAEPLMSRLHDAFERTRNDELPSAVGASVRRIHNQAPT